MTTWLLNSAVMPAGCYGEYTYSPTTWSELSVALKNGGIVSRIGYVETVDLIQTMTGIRPPLSTDVSEFEDGDTAWIVRLKYRVQRDRKGLPTEATSRDWEVGRIVYRKRS